MVALSTHAPECCVDIVAELYNPFSHLQENPCKTMMTRPTVSSPPHLASKETAQKPPRNRNTDETDSDGLAGSSEVLLRGPGPPAEVDRSEKSRVPTSARRREGEGFS